MSLGHMTEKELVDSSDLPDEQKRILDLWLIYHDISKVAEMTNKQKGAVRTSLYRSRIVYLDYKSHTDRIEELASREKKRKFRKVLIG